MSVIKIQKREPGYALIDNRALSDPRLSWKAKGVLSYLLSKPNDWKVQVEDLANHSTDGEYAIRAALKELMATGYAERIINRTTDGEFISFDYIIHEEPLRGYPQMDNPQMGKPKVDNPHVGNRDVNKTESTKTELTKTELTKTEGEKKKATPPPPPPPIKMYSSDEAEALDLFQKATGMTAFPGRSEEKNWTPRLCGIVQKFGSVTAAAPECKRLYEYSLKCKTKQGRPYSRGNDAWVDWVLTGDDPTTNHNGHNPQADLDEGKRTAIELGWMLPDGTLTEEGRRHAK